MPDIIIQDIVPRRQYVAGGGGPTVFAYPFPVFAQTDVIVYLTPAGDVADDVTQILIYNVDYTVIINAAPVVGGTITLTVAANVGDIITIVRAQPDNRLNNYIDGGLFEATIVNTDFDRTVLMAQQNQMYDRTLGVHYNNSATITAITDNILPVLPANCAWIKSADGTQIQAIPVNNGINPFNVQLPTTDDAIARYNGTGGNLQNSGVIIDDTNNITGVLTLAVGDLLFDGNTAQATNANGILNLSGGPGAGAVAVLGANPLTFYEATNTFFTALVAGALGANVTFTLPTLDGGAGAPLVTSGAGALSFPPHFIPQMLMYSLIGATSNAANIPLDNTIPQIGEGTQLLTITITPVNAASSLRVEVQLPFVAASAAATLMIALFRDAGANALNVATTFVTANTDYSSMSLVFSAPSTATVATTFTVRYGADAGTMYVGTNSTGTVTFGGAQAASITVTEFR